MPYWYKRAFASLERIVESDSGEIRAQLPLAVFTREYTEKKYAVNSQATYSLRVRQIKDLKIIRNLNGPPRRDIIQVVTGDIAVRSKG